MSVRLLHVTTTDMSLALLLGPQLRAFADAGYEVSTASAPGPYVERLQAWGVRHIPLRHATRALAPHHDVQALLELRAAFLAAQPHIVHTHNPKPGVYGRLAAKAARVPVIVNTVHGLYAQPGDSWSKRTFVYGLERLAASCSSAELVQNPEDLETLAALGVPRAKLHLLGNGVDLGRFDPSVVDEADRQAVRNEFGAEPGDVVVGAVGRLVWEKGYRELLQAADIVRRQFPGARFVVIGPTDPDKADAVGPADIARAEAAGVRFLGLRHDVDRLYAGMDLYVLASHREGFPRSAMEAAAMGLPLVATDIRGCREVVTHGVNGLFAPVHDITALAAAIGKLVGDAELRRRMGEASRRKAVAEFDQQRVIDRTLGVYDTLLPRRAPEHAA
ncbi:MAG: glycosyltransferase family 4 protein [Actinomycetota bacterium]|nr:glycosyltransferase family 4 protein [Actinomycetota bacterium]